MTRRFASTPLARAEVTAMLDLARRAPSAGYSQGTHFVALDSAALARFWEVTGAGAWFAAGASGVLDAPTVVLVLGDEASYTARYAEPDKAGRGLERAEGWPVPYWLVDAGMAAQNLLLLATDRGLGALLFGVFRNAEALMAGLGIPAGVHLVGAIALGWPAAGDGVSGSPRKRARRPVDEVVHWNAW